MEDVGPRAKKATVCVALGFALALASTSEGCRNATQVELVITYDGPCKDLEQGSVGFIIATDPYVAEDRIKTNTFTTTTTDCTQLSPTLARVGTLVVTPNDSTDHASIIVLAGFGKRVEECKAADGYFSCIIARRTFNFVDHTGLTLEMPLDPDCKNVPCDAVSTCARGQCVDSTVDCSGGRCNKPGELPDGGLATVDAPTSSDAYTQQDAPPPTDGPIVDAPTDSPIVDAPMDAPFDGASCTGQNNVAVSCKTPPNNTKMCAPGNWCCYGFTPGDAGDAGGPSYDCRPSGSCASMAPNYIVQCLSSQNCGIGQTCCLFMGMGTQCSTSCPTDGGFAATVCISDCECKPGRSCTGTGTVGDSPPQDIRTCQ